jgi:hypothetical protein
MERNGDAVGGSTVLVRVTVSEQHLQVGHLHKHTSYPVKSSPERFGHRNASFSISRPRSGLQSKLFWNGSPALVSLRLGHAVPCHAVPPQSRTLLSRIFPMASTTACICRPTTAAPASFSKRNACWVCIRFPAPSRHSRYPHCGVLGVLAYLVGLCRAQFKYKRRVYKSIPPTAAKMNTR